MEDMQQEYELIQAFQAGDESAFDELYRRYARRIYRALYAYCSDEHLAEDLLQETFMRAYRGLKGFRFKSAFYTWLYRVALNTAHTQVRRRGRIKEQPLHSEEQVVASGSTDEAVDGAYVRERIKGAMECLPRKQRQVFALRFYEGLKFGEVAAAMGISDGSARVNYHHAMEKLRLLLGDLS